MDGSQPTSSTIPYAGAFVLSGATTIRAVAIACGISTLLAGSFNLQAATIALTPSIITLAPSEMQTITAPVSGTSNKVVTWTRTPAIGSISSTGLYISPTSLTNPQAVKVMATSVADSTKRASVTVSPAPRVSVAVTPGSVTLTPSQTQAIRATVSTTNTAVTWSLSPIVGTISAVGLYTAQATVPHPGTFTISATSVAGPTKSASTGLTIVPLVGITYYLAPAAAGGSDANSGLSATAPWLTPNHDIDCGDLILAVPSRSYSTANFTSGKWGTVTCPAGSNVAWLKCMIFDACKISSSNAGQGGVWIDKSYWGIQGWEVTITGGPYAGCFVAKPSSVTPTEIHHIIFANDIANGCQGGGFGSSNVGTSASVDYLAIVGNIAYNGSEGNGECYSGISVYQPAASDTLAGTHIYIAGNLSYDNVEPDPCAGGTPTDGEGIILDTINGKQGGLAAYAQQIVVDDNIAILNGASGIDNGGSGNSLAEVYIIHNTVFGNFAGPHQNASSCGQLLLAGYPILPANAVSHTKAYLNLATPLASKEPACGSNPAYAYYVSNVNGTDRVYSNLAYSPAGNNLGYSNAVGFTYGLSNVVGTSPNFANPINPGAPDCSGASSVSDCIAAVVANFTPTTPAAAAYGYQAPLSTPAYDPLFPQWLCNVNLPAGLLRMGCRTAP